MAAERHGDLAGLERADRAALDRDIRDRRSASARVLGRWLRPASLGTIGVTVGSVMVGLLGE